jgi:beta-glucosidase
MQSLLRGEFGYDGIISSDGGAVTYSHTEHHYTPDVPTAAAASLNAGVDLNTGGNNNDGTGWWFGYQTLNQSLSRGLIQVAQLQTAVSRLLLLRMRLGMFDPADVVPYRRLTAATTVDSPSHRRVAREYATKSMVLLKNHNSTLPLNGDVRSIAIVGPNANSTSVLLSNYAGCRLPFDGPIPVDCRLVTAVAGMQANAPVNVSVAFEPGCHLNTSDAKVAAAAVQLAAQSDITIAIMGLSTTNDEGRAVFEAEAHDRLELELSAAQSELLEQLCAVASNRLVLVLLNGGPVSLTAEQVKCADAIVEAFYPGEEGGNALADVLYGVVSPSGRLPYTMYQGIRGFLSMHYSTANLLDLVAAGAVLAPRLSMRMAEPPGQTFRYYTGEPAYGFGFGLSYTSFEYTGLHLSSTSISSSGSVTVKVDVTNVGLTFVADEVVQLYATYVNETTAQKCQSFPLYELKAFRKLVAMLPLETRTVTVVIAASELALVGKDCKMAVQAGQYQLHVGGRSPSLGVYQPEQPLLLASFHVE